MRKSTRTASILAMVAALLLLWSCGKDDKKNPVNPGGGGTTADLVIHIKSGSAQLGANAYTPNPATVAVGQTVQWKNDDAMVHTATASGTFNTGNIGGGASSAVITMSTQGSFNYVCAIAGHNMSGTLNVNP